MNSPEKNWALEGGTLSTVSSIFQILIESYNRVPVMGSVCQIQKFIEDKFKNMNNISWYFNLYYKFRDYPIGELNSTLKSSELKTLYSNMLRKVFVLFQLDSRKDGEIQGLISKNNYDLMLNKKAENNLAQEEVANPIPAATASPAFTSQTNSNQVFNSTSSLQNEREPEGSEEPSQSREDSHIRLSTYSKNGRRESRGWVVELGPFERNMDVFYELMIKMIRVSFRRLMIETFALDRYGMHVSKEAIRQILQASSQFESLLDQKEGGKESQINDEMIQIVHYPPTVQEMKFEFLKYCISSKVYNNPREANRMTSSQSSLSSHPDEISDQCIPSQSSEPPAAPSIPDNQIQELILKVSAGQTSIFNRIIELYQKEVKNCDRNKTEILGVKHIAQSILDFANKQFCNQSMPLIFGSEHTSMKRGINHGNFRKHTDGSLSNSNILLATWLDLILFKQTPNTLLSIIEELVKIENQETLIVDPPKRTERGKTPQNKEFYYKISSYLHLLILNSTKNIFIQSLLKINYLLVLSKDVIGGECGFKQSFRHINFKNYQEKVNGVTKVYDNIQLTYDAWNDKYLWKEEALGILISKWKVIAHVITQLCAKNNQVFFVAIFEKCVALLDKQLGMQVELIEKLMMVVQNIECQNATSPDNHKAKHTCKVLCSIIAQIIGFGQTVEETTEAEPQDKYLNINNIVNLKSEVDRYKESTFANREECAQEISKWNQIISENIYVYSQYKHNLDLISKIFKNNYLYVALWFSKFHGETKTLVKKVNRDRLQKIFGKFSQQIPALWESMTTDNDKKRMQQSRFKRTDRGKVRNRISSIKIEKHLSVVQKKAIVLNYMIKAELQLYSHYMLINYLNSQKNFNELFEKEAGNNRSIKSKPEIFSHRIIKKLVLFSGEQERLKTIKLEKETFASITRRTNKHMSYRFEEGVSSFNIEGMRTMNNIKKTNVNCDFQDLLNAIHHFEKPMDLELELEDKWKDKFGDQEIEYLGELNDYVRYLNEINYLYEFWSWQESNSLSKEDKEKAQKKKRIELLDGSEYNSDLEEIDLAFTEIQDNESLIHEVSVFKGESRKIMHKQQLNEMLKRIKIHNKELYMIIEAIIEGENYFKLIASNLIGRDQNSKFRSILEEIITHYKTNKREKPSVRMLEKMKETLQFQFQKTKKDPKSAVKSKVSELYMAEDGREPGQYSLPELSRKNSKKGCSMVSRFQFAPEYYKIQSKVLRINCLIAALEIDNPIFRNIKHSHVLSEERLEKLNIIGCQYYDKLENLLQADKVQDNSQLMIGEDTLMRVKYVYQRKLLLLIVAVINMNYTIDDKVKRFTGRGRKQASRVQFSNIPEEDLRDYPKVLAKYTDLLKKFLYWKIKENIKRVQQRQTFQKMNVQNDKKDQKEFSVCTFIEEVLELSEKNEQCQQDLLLIRLQVEIQKENNMKFSQEFRRSMEEESCSLAIYGSEQEKVEYLRKKLSYLLMREMYFTLNYENDFLTQKSVNSKKNYMIYQQRILKFYEEIAMLDYQSYIQKKEEEIKKRSIHLKNYEFKYEKKPSISILQANVNQLICCLFNQLLTTYTTKVEQRVMNMKPKPVIVTSYKESNIYQNYCATQYSKQLTEEQQIVKPILKKKKKIPKEKKQSISSIFAHIFFSKEEEPSQQQLAVSESIDPREKLGNFMDVLVYSPKKYELSQSLKLYFKIIGSSDYSYSLVSSSSNSKRYSPYRNPPSVQQPITEKELQLMKNNQASLISLLKSQFLQNIHLMKCKLINRNLISNVEKLYINLDVRHKVFESFQDRILNYQLQKAKIYHQYMDYIRGLKLDIYSHMAGEESMPYIKIIQSVKLYRLKIKKMELQQRVSQEFQKNLVKWNRGIQVYLDEHGEWLCQEEKDWSAKEAKYEGEIKTLLDIYTIVVKEVQRQNKMIKKKITASAKSISTPKEEVQRALQVLVPTPQPESLLKKCSYLKHKATRNIQFSKQGTQTPARTCKMTESTKQNTKYEKLTMTNHSAANLRGQSCGGLRGISIKYDVSNFLQNQPEKQEKQRMTEAFARSGVKTANATIYNRKQIKRYQSAQKLRPHEDYR